MTGLSPCGALVRRADPDRFLTALFAPPARREALLTLYAFNVELSRAAFVTREPALALIRLHWWREVVEGTPKQHEVATPLAALLATGQADPAELLALVDAREAETEEIATLEDWRAYLIASAGGLAVAAGRLLGAPGHDRLRHFGAAYGAAGVMRSVPALAAQGRCLLPADVLVGHAASVTAPASLPPVFKELAQVGLEFLAAARQHPLPRAARSAALPGTLARRDLRRPGVSSPRGIGDRMAVAWAALF